MGWGVGVLRGQASLRCPCSHSTSISNRPFNYMMLEYIYSSRVSYLTTFQTPQVLPSKSVIYQKPRISHRCRQVEVHKLQGREVQERIDRQIAEAVATSFPVNLGGERGEGWGQCLAVQVSHPSAHRLLYAMHPRICNLQGKWVLFHAPLVHFLPTHWPSHLASNKHWVTCLLMR